MYAESFVPEWKEKTQPKPDLFSTEMITWDYPRIWIAILIVAKKGTANGG